MHLRRQPQYSNRPETKNMKWCRIAAWSVLFSSAVGRTHNGNNYTGTDVEEPGTGEGDLMMMYDFYWRGQFAGYAVNGRFGFYANDIPEGGIVREEHLRMLDVHFS